MIITKEHQEALVNKYIKEKHNSDECIGFIDGLNAILKFIENNSFNEPTMQELEDMIDYINTQVAIVQLDDFMDKAGKLINFVKKYQQLK
jgi:hypothetical protein